MAASIEYTTNGTGVIESTARGSGSGSLQNASVSVISGSCGGGDILATVGLRADPDDEDSIVLVLASGYISPGRPLLWQGSVKIDSGLYYYLRTVSLASVVVKASFDTENS